MAQTLHTASIRFEVLLRWATLVSGGSVLFYLGIGLVYSDLRTIVSAVLIAVYTVALLASRRVLQAGRLGAAALLVSLGLLLVAVGLTVAQPALWISYAVVPMLAAAVLLQYAPVLRIYGSLAGCALATATIAILGETLPAGGTLPELFVVVMRIVSLIMTIAFVLFLLWQFRSRLEESLAHVREANERLTVQNSALVTANDRLQEEISMSQQLVAQVTALETPVTHLADSVLYAPIFGYITDYRAEQLRSKLLDTVYASRANWIIVDVQGVPQIDTRVAGALIGLFQAIHLLGCRVCICGISAEVAQIMTNLDLSFGDIATVRNPQEALALTTQLHSLHARA